MTDQISEALCRNRIIFLHGIIDGSNAAEVIQQMLYLEALDPREDIHLYINSAGGSVSDGLAIYDTMRYIRCDVSTICVGMAASMGAFLLAGGVKGKRYALPHSEILIHQPIGGIQGQATDVLIAARRLTQLKRTLGALMADFTKKDMAQVLRDTERDFWMTPKEAMAYGIVDEIKDKRSVENESFV